MKEFISKNEEDMRQIAHDFVKNLETKFPNPLDGAHQGVFVVGFYGELGAGKTTFMKYIAEALGVKETIQSPTFVIVKSYKLKVESRKEQEADFKLAPLNFQTLIHIDAYRIEKESEMLNLGWLGLLESEHNLIFVEWPERIARVMPAHTKISFEHISESERKIIFES